MTDNSFTNVEVKQKNKSNRKGKKQWRKNIDLNQVEDGLKQNEVDQIKYGVSGSQIPDEALFEEDTLGDQKETTTPSIVKSTYIDQVLNARSAVPTVQSKVYSQKKTTSQTNKNTVVQPQIIKKFGKSKQARKLASLWDNEEFVDPESQKITDIDSLHAPVIKRPHTMNMKPILKEDSTVVHPGYSYQPEKEKHKELIEASKQQAEAKVLQNQKYREITATIKAGKNELGEMDEIEYSDEEVEGEGGEDKDDEDEDEEQLPTEKTTSADPKRLTKADRKKKNNLKIQKKLQNQKLKKKQENITFTNLKNIKKATEQTTKQIEEKIELTKKQNEESKLLPKVKFGKYAVKPEKIEVTDEVAPTLRNIQTASNPFEQHYHKFTKKNLVENRNRIRNKKTSKVKAYVKPSAKDFTN